MARNFEPVSRAFLVQAAPRGCARALDLGCGPGFTTRLLAEVCAPGELIGLDASEAFVARARADTGADARATFQICDVTRLPLPGAPADLINARLLLAHLAEPEALLAGWATQLRPNGRLLVDEVEWIRTEDPVFLRYLELVTGMLRARGQELYIGARLEVATRGDRRVACELRALTLTSAQVAAMFSPNLAEFRQQPSVRAQASESELDALAAALEARISGAEGETATWAMRQLAIEA